MSASVTVVNVEFATPQNTVDRRALFVGQRVRVENEPTPATAQQDTATVAKSTDEEIAATAKATVRYIGPVAAAKDPNATMIGVEWDDRNRGKNDGSVAGKRYFSCEKGQGSFLHPARILVGPTAITTAIAEKYETRFKADANPQGSLFLVAEYNKKNESLAKKASDASSVPPAAVAAPAAANPIGAAEGAAAGSALRHIPVVFQGEEYMQGRIAAKLANILDMTLTQSEISCTFDPTLSLEAEVATLSSKIPNCQTIDLTDNLLVDWKQIAHLVKALPKLRLVALNSNNLNWNTLLSSAAPNSLQLDPLFTTGETFSNIQILVLNNVPKAWESVLFLARHQALPNLGELHLCKNHITSLTEGFKTCYSPDQLQKLHVKDELAIAFPKLHTLELSFNDVSSWEEVRSFERLPRLERLLLNANQLTQIEYVDEVFGESKTQHPFASLRSLGVNANKLNSFDSVTQLTRFPQLSELRLQSNEKLEALTMELNAGGGVVAATVGQQLLANNLQTVAEADAKRNIAPNTEASAAATSSSASSSASSSPSSSFTPSPQSAALLRLQLISRLPSLNALNRSQITERERMDAEKYYILVAFQAAHNRARAAAAAAAAANDGTSLPTDSPTAGGITLTNEDIERSFPRYTQLVTIHGDPAATVSAMQKQLVEPTGSTLASKLVEVHMMQVERVVAGAKPTPTTSKPIEDKGFHLEGFRVLSSQTKKLSSTLTIQATRTLLEKAFKIPPHAKSKYVFRYQEPNNDGSASSSSSGNKLQELEEALKPLNYYGVSNGGYILLINGL